MTGATKTTDTFTATTSATNTSLGQLISTYLQPGSCMGLRATIDPSGSSKPASAYRAKLCPTIKTGANEGNSTDLDPLDDDFLCWPPVTQFFGPSATLLSIPRNRGLYSPGLVCPLGYEPACSATYSDDSAEAPLSAGSNFKFQFGVAHGETAIGCCPEGGWSCSSLGANQTCFNTFVGDEVEPTICSVSPAPVLVSGTMTNSLGDTIQSTSSIFITKTSFIDIQGATTTQTHTATEDRLTTTFTNTFSALPDFTVFAPLFQLNHRATDLPPSAPSSSLSTSTKITLGTVVPSVVLLASAVFGFLFMRKRRRRKQFPDPSAPVYHEKPELDATTGSSGSAKVPPNELSGWSRQELEPTPVHELPVPNVVHEIDDH